MSPDKLRHELASSFHVIKDRSNDEELCIICPVPGCGDKSGNRFVNVKTLVTHCWRCQGKQPLHVKSLFRTLGLEFEDNHILEPEEIRELLRGKSQTALTPIQEVPLPKGFELLSDNRRSCYWTFCQNMAERKHLEIEDLEEAEAGFTRDGPWEPFCIFPVTEGPRIVYYQGRTYSDDGFEKTKKFPSKKEIPYGMRYWIYNLDALADPKVELVIVVESILNVLSLKKRLRELEFDHIIPICVFTHFITRSQVAKMRRYRHIKDWCLLFDSDSSDIAQDTAMALNAVLPTSVAAMPPGTNPDGSVRGTNDANDDVDGALLAVNSRSKPNPDRTKPLKIYPPQDRPWREAVAQE